MDDARARFEAARVMFGSLVSGLRDLKWDDIPQPAKQFISANSCITAVQVILVLLWFCPGLVASPALALMGFSSAGPIAGDIDLLCVPKHNWMADAEPRVCGRGIPIRQRCNLDV